MSAFRAVVSSLAIVLFASLPAMEAAGQAAEELKTLKVGDTAKDVEFQPLEGDKVKLSVLTKDGPVVLVVLRGFPGYQCPICSRQVADLRRHAQEFKELRARVVLVYPGPAADLKNRAEEFLRGTKLPEPLMLVIDPDYKFTNLYALRWDAPRETAYPSTFVLDQMRVVKFRKVSQSHGDRAKTEDVLKALREMQGAVSSAG